MSESWNVQLLKEYLGAPRASDGERMTNMLSPDLKYWVLPGSAFSDTHDKVSIGAPTRNLRRSVGSDRVDVSPHNCAG
jgi:hypothetical protein